jgi:hypothetical protein
MTRTFVALLLMTAFCADTSTRLPFAALIVRADQCLSTETLAE